MTLRHSHASRTRFHELQRVDSIPSLQHYLYKLSFPHGAQYSGEILENLENLEHLDVLGIVRVIARPRFWIR